MPKPSHNELLEEIEVLKKKNKNLEHENKKLKEHEKLLEHRDMYRALFKHAGFSIIVLDESNGEIVLYNNEAYEMLGYTNDEFRDISIDDIDTGSIHGGMAKHLGIVKNKGSYTFRTLHKTKNHEIRHMLISSVSVDINGKCFHQSIGSDITELVMAEQKLEKAQTELENRVTERTAQLNEKTNNLKEMNAALNILLKKRDTDRNELEESFVENIRVLVYPYLQQLKVSMSNDQRNNYIEIIESTLKDITSQFSKKLSDKLLNLSPSEIRIANFVKQGKTSKDIASILGVSYQTVETHRVRIRRKVGLNNKKISLQTYLQSL